MPWHQRQAGAPALALGGKSLFKHPLTHLGRNAAAGVLHADEQALLLLLNADLHLTHCAVRHIFKGIKGILDQVAQQRNHGVGGQAAAAVGVMAGGVQPEHHPAAPGRG